MIGQSFSTSSSYYRLNQIGVVFGDADNGANFSTTSETIHLFRVDTTTGNLTPVGSYTGTGTPYEAKTSFKNTNINFTNGPILAPNTTYAFTVTENSTGAVALIIPKVATPVLGATQASSSYQYMRMQMVPARIVSSPIAAIRAGTTVRATR